MLYRLPQPPQPEEPDEWDFWLVVIYSIGMICIIGGALAYVITHGMLH